MILRNVDPLQGPFESSHQLAWAVVSVPHRRRAFGLQPRLTCLLSRNREARHEWVSDTVEEPLADVLLFVPRSVDAETV